MRKIVDGKLYDTEIAKLITGWNKGEGYFYISECLYRTRKGTFFLECYGGACTKYKESVINNGWTDGSLLKVLSEEETIDWLMENNEIDVLEELFPGVLQEG